MKKIILLLLLPFCLLNYTSAKNDTAFFVFKFKPGISNPSTVIALGNDSLKFNIQYKLSSASEWVEFKDTGSDVQIEINQTSGADDIYDVRYLLSDTEVPVDVVMDFGEHASKLVDITQWGTSTGKISWDFGVKNIDDPQRYSALADISANDIVKFSSISFRRNTVFQGTSSPMNKWNVENVTSLSGCFQGAVNFNGNISNWNVGAVKNFSSIFNGATAFNQDITGWNVSSGTNFSSMLQNLSSFNQDISGWDVSSATTFQSMFNGASSFNQNVSGWNVSNSKNFRSMFQKAAAFNQDISRWEVGESETFQSMFQQASKFNINISGWNVSNATIFESMFNNATAFDKDLALWTPSSATNMKTMFNNSGMSTVSYDNTLIGWWDKKNQLQNNIEFGVVGLLYNDSEVARNGFINEKGWDFKGDKKGIKSSVENINQKQLYTLQGNRLIFTDNLQSDVQIYSLSGSLMNTYSPANEIILNLPDGVYILKVENAYSKIIINKM